MLRTEDEALIERYIEPDPHGQGVADATLRDFGTPVWALIGYWEASGHDEARTARAYELPQEAVTAALAFYRKHQALIDARRLLNVA